ncbi:hypothetical protein [Calycomorphotria hydatis]|uniref:Uncharacterized protein n=1 Tax=Calycomorphotria hydatis TaxID=2528027 RepID=A0A517T6C6_9PLAN|nr:hypothetical protein [Calycomorphotria hydatis]QDT63924.1 hypothetical protein V22_11520 [Calycomorphotria hydatis]
MIELQLKPNPTSTRPTISVERDGNEYFIKESDGCGGCGIYFMATLSVGLAILAYYLFDNFKWDDFPVWIIAGAAALGSLALAYQTIRSILIRRALQPGRLYFDHWPAYRGEEVIARYERELKAQVLVRELQASFYCEESATYTVGTDTHTVKEKAHEQTFDPVAVDPSATTIQHEFALQIPFEGFPSLDVSNNKIRWVFQVKLIIDSYPDATSEFELLVQPEVLS